MAAATAAVKLTKASVKTLLDPVFKQGFAFRIAGYLSGVYGSACEIAEIIPRIHDAVAVSLPPDGDEWMRVCAAAREIDIRLANSVIVLTPEYLDEVRRLLYDAYISPDVDDPARKAMKTISLFFERLATSVPPGALETARLPHHDAVAIYVVAFALVAPLPTRRHRSRV